MQSLVNENIFSETKFIIIDKNPHDKKNCKLERIHRGCKALNNIILQCALYSMWQLQTICLFTFHFGVVTTTHDRVSTFVVIPLTTVSIDRNMSPLTCRGSSLIQCFWLRPERGCWEGSFSQVHNRALGYLEWYQPSSLYFEWLHGWKGEQPEIEEKKTRLNNVQNVQIKCNFKHILLSICLFSVWEDTISTFQPSLKIPQVTVSSSGETKEIKKMSPSKTPIKVKMMWTQLHLTLVCFNNAGTECLLKGFFV